MDILIIISNPQAAFIAQSLVAAAERANASWSIFFTNDGVKALGDKTFVMAMSGAQEAVSCHESWLAHMGNKPCPVIEGSQTNNSALVAKAARIISL